MQGVEMIVTTRRRLRLLVMTAKVTSLVTRSLRMPLGGSEVCEERVYTTLISEHVGTDKHDDRDW
jgi:hypothetical protein